MMEWVPIFVLLVLFTWLRPRETLERRGQAKRECGDRL